MDPIQTPPQQPPEAPYQPPQPIEPAPPVMPLNSIPPQGSAHPSPPQTMSVMAIVGLVLAFVVPVVGIIVSAIALAKIGKNGQKGRGLAIAGLVIGLINTVVGIILLIALVGASFSGVQQKARDTERRTDINALHTQVEAYYAQNGMYPTLFNMNDTSFRNKDLKGIENDAFSDPKSPQTNQFTDKPSTTSLEYAYTVKPDGCDNISKMCTSYTLLANLEGETETDYTKRSLAN